jgi:hypothetical protein
MVILIKQEDLSKNTPLGGNIDATKYIPALKAAQATTIKPILGEELYDKLVEDFKNNNLEGDYLTLYDEYVKPMLIHLGASYYLTTGGYQIDNKGIYKANSENYKGLDQQEIDYIVKQQEKLYRHYKDCFYTWIETVFIHEYEVNQSFKTRTKVGGWSFKKDGC